MKRIGNLYEKIYDIDNLRYADTIARKGKTNSYGVKRHDKNRDANLQELHSALKEGVFETSPYDIFKIYEPKEREIYRLPYYPDRIVHHAVMNVVKPIWLSVFTKDTYSCIEGRGIHLAVERLKLEIKDFDYCLKIDVKKFYPSIDHDVLKRIVRRKIKDVRLLALLDEIIDSAQGVPIGNYLSQYFANLYLAYFDHWVKECLKVKSYFRYADDMVFLSNDKEELRRWFFEMQRYLRDKLRLEAKHNYQTFPISRGIDFLGYVFYKNKTRIRKRIKLNMFKRVAKIKRNPHISQEKLDSRLCSWLGWLKHCDSRGLRKKIAVKIYEERMKRFSELGIPATNLMVGDKVKISKIINVEIEVLSFKIKESKYKDKGDRCLYLQINYRGEKAVVFTGSSVLIKQIEQVPADAFPFTTTIKKEGEHYEFT